MGICSSKKQPKEIDEPIEGKSSTSDSAQQQLQQEQKQEQQQEQSKSQQDAPKQQQPQQQSNNAQEQKEKPKPMVFAIMRNGHEVIRGAMKECDAAVDDLAAFKVAWKDFMTWMDLHAAMEDGADSHKGFFAIVKEVKGDEVADPLAAAHVTIHELEQKIHSSIESSDMEALKESWTTFHTENEKHLKDEEAIMMPVVQQQAKAGTNMKEVMITHLLPGALTNMEHFVKFAMKILEKHHGDMPRARVFAHALKAVATEEQWSDWKVWIRESLSEQLYDKMVDEIGPL